MVILKISVKSIKNKSTHTEQLKSDWIELRPNLPLNLIYIFLCTIRIKFVKFGNVRPNNPNILTLRQTPPSNPHALPIIVPVYRFDSPVMEFLVHVYLTLLMLNVLNCWRVD